MERLKARKNAVVQHLRRLAREETVRQESGEYLCEGMTALADAVAAHAPIRSVVWNGSEPETAAPDLHAALQFVADREIFDYLCPLQNAPGPVFTVAMQHLPIPENTRNAVVLENLQDPGNVGTVIRTANALGIDAVVLVGNCASPYNPKTVRATMGALFRQPVVSFSKTELEGFLAEKKLRLLGAALSKRASDIRTASLDHCAVAIGSEGSGLSAEMLSLCSGEIVIPMRPESESLNAAVAASVCMWEMVRSR